MNSPNASAGPSRLGASSEMGSSTPMSHRLYVGNLSPTVDEYTLLQIFSKFGKVTKMDFMFHKTGVQKGKPRGYAFVEFSTKEDAAKAMTKLHERLLRGRKLVVTAANSAPATDLPLPHKGRRYADQPKTTTLSLLKSRRHPQSASAQIAAMEAKLAAMDATKPKDEDYVPGSRAYPLAPAPLSASVSAFGSVSPAVNDDSPRRRIGSPDAYYVPSPEGRAGDDEDRLGDDEAAQAAADLEQELRAQFDGNGMTARDGHTDHASPAPHVVPASASQAAIGADTGSPAPTSATTAPALISATLPPKPAEGAPTLPVDTRNIAREAAFQKGLAGLPKRPAFVP